MRDANLQQVAELFMYTGDYKIKWNQLFFATAESACSKKGNADFEWWSLGKLTVVKLTKSIAMQRSLICREKCQVALSIAS